MNETESSRLPRALLGILAGVLVLLLAGCVSLSEPNRSNSLVVGTVEQWGVNYPSNNGARLNGTHRSGIILTFRSRPFTVKNSQVSNLGHIVLKMDFSRGLSWGQQTLFETVRE